MYLTAAQACGKLGISRWTLARLIAAGEIHAIKGPAKNSHLRILEKEIADYEARRSVVPTEAGAA